MRSRDDDDASVGDDELRAVYKHKLREVDAAAKAKIESLEARGLAYTKATLNRYDEALAELRDLVEPPGWLDTA